MSLKEFSKLMCIYNNFSTFTFSTVFSLWKHVSLIYFNGRNEELSKKAFKGKKNKHKAAIKVFESHREVISLELYPMD